MWNKKKPALKKSGGQRPTKSSRRLSPGIARAILNTLGSARGTNHEVALDPHLLEFLKIGELLGHQPKGSYDEIREYKGCLLREAALKEAIKRTIFPKGESSILLKNFLSRLYPGEDTHRVREELLHEALRRIPFTFMKYFRKGEPGWPAKGRAEILAEDSSPAQPVCDAIYSQIKDGVNFEMACTVAPVALAWQEFKNDPKTRGSLGLATRLAKAEILQTMGQERTSPL